MFLFLGIWHTELEGNVHVYVYPTTPIIRLKGKLVFTFNFVLLSFQGT